MSLKKIKKITEEYLTTIKSSGDYRHPVDIDVIKNPSRIELNKFLKSVDSAEGARFILDTEGDLYVFRADVMHYEVYVPLNISWDYLGLLRGDEVVISHETVIHKEEDDYDPSEEDGIDEEATIEDFMKKPCIQRLNFNDSQIVIEEL